MIWCMCGYDVLSQPLTPRDPQMREAEVHVVILNVVHFFAVLQVEFFLLPFIIVILFFLVLCTRPPKRTCKNDPKK